MSDMERPANSGGPNHQSEQRSDSTDSTETVVCRIDATRNCPGANMVHGLGAYYCRPCLDEYRVKLRRRVARRNIGADPDSTIGVGIVVMPAVGWADGWYLLKCDMCPREWVGQPYEACSTCATWWREAQHHHEQHHNKRSNNGTPQFFTTE
jgi:hypothetical protein